MQLPHMHPNQAAVPCTQPPLCNAPIITYQHLRLHEFIHKVDKVVYVGLCLCTRLGTVT